MKLPAGQGLWPAFWMLGANYPQLGHPACGEVDVRENLGSEPGRVWGTVHGPGYAGAGLTGKAELPAGQRYADDVHTFAVDWTPEGFAFAVDVVVYHRVPKSAAGTNEWVFDRPFFLTLNLAVGGSWPGAPDASTPFPSTLLVDHVALYR